MFKINKHSNNGVLEIINTKTEEVIAQLKAGNDKGTRKNLFVLDEIIGSVTSHDQAINALKAFFDGNRAQMLSNCIVIDELNRDLKAVKSEYGYKLIANDILRLEKHNRQLERFNSLVYK